MGRLMAIGIPFMPAYRVFQVLAGAAMYLVILALMKEFFRDRLMAWCAYLLAGFGTGFSWLISLVSEDFFKGELMGSDILHGDSFPVHTFWTFPHLALSVAMHVSLYLFMYRAVIRRQRKWTLYASGVALLMGFSHPYHFVSTVPVLFFWFLALQIKHGKSMTRIWTDLAILVAFMAPGTLYFKTFFKNAPNFSHWAAQNVTRTSGWLNVVMGFGILMILPLFSYRGFTPLKKYTDSYLLIAIWPLVNFFCHFCHPLIFFTQRLGQGLIFPLAILSTWAFFGTVLPMLRKGTKDSSIDDDILESQASLRRETADLKRDPRLPWVIALSLLTLPTTALHVDNQLHELATGKPYFHHTLDTKMKIPDGELEALKFLNKDARDFPIVLSGPEIGLIMPGFAPVRAFVGHFTQTTNLQERMGFVNQFYSPTATDEFRSRLLASFEFGYVWWGRDEDVLGGARPNDSAYLTRVFDQNGVTIYRVNRAAITARQGFSNP
jgi:hypothetical protein